MEAHLRQPAAAPDPMAGDRIDDQADDAGIETIGRKFCAFRHGARNDRRSRCTEDRLENQIRVKRHAFRQDGRVIAAGQEIKPADEFARPGKHNAEADQPEDGCADTEIHQVFHDDIPGVFGACEAGFDHGKTCLHEED